MKKIISLALAVLLVVSLAACGGSSAPAPTTPSTSGTDQPSAPSGNTPAEPTAETPLGIDCSGDKTVTLRVSYMDPDNSICGQYVRDLEAQITEASQGTIQFDNYPGGSLYSGPDALDGLTSGGCDMIWSPCTLFAGLWPIAEFCYLPLNGINCSRMACDVMNEMFNTMPEFQEEFADYYVMMIGGCTVSPLCTTDKQIKSVDDLQGLTIRFAGSLSKQWATDVGLTPMTVPTPDTYENLQKNIINGCANDWHNIIAFSLTDVLGYCMEFELSPASFCVLLNKDTVSKLSANQQAVLDQFANGYAASMAGYYWDSTRSACLTSMEENGVTVYECPEDVYALFTSEEVKADVAAAYVEYLNGMGLDGADILAKGTAAVAKYADKYADTWGDAPDATKTENGFAVEGWTALKDMK